MSINLFSRKARETSKSDKWVFGTLLAFGITGIIASFTLAVEEFHLLKHPGAILSCTFNLVLNCATVMKTWQASVFGFPNMYIGLIGFPLVILIALLGLSKVKFPRWFLIGAEIGIVFWTLFAYWLFFSSIYVIQVLCPWCLVVTFSMTMLSAAITNLNLRHDTFNLKSGVNKKVVHLLEKDYDKLIVAAWVVLLIALVFAKFGDALFA
jgi:uncharacterized membrane protein